MTVRERGRLRSLTVAARAKVLLRRCVKKEKRPARREARGRFGEQRRSLGPGIRHARLFDTTCRSRSVRSSSARSSYCRSRCRSSCCRIHDGGKCGRAANGSECGSGARSSCRSRCRSTNRSSCQRRSTCFRSKRLQRSTCFRSSCWRRSRCSPRRSRSLHSSYGCGNNRCPTSDRANRPWRSACPKARTGRRRPRGTEWHASSREGLLSGRNELGVFFEVRGCSYADYRRGPNRPLAPATEFPMRRL